MSEIFIVGSLFFWLLLVVEIVSFAGFVVYGRGVGAVLSFVVFLVLLNLFGDIDSFNLIRHHPLNFAMLVVGYIGVGATWLFPFWRFYILSLKERADDCKYAFLKYQADLGNLSHAEIPTSVRSVSIPESLKGKWSNYKYDNRLTSYFQKPIVRENKDRLLAAAAGWPMSMTITLLDRGLRHIMLQVYYWIGDKLQAMADNAWKDVE